MSSTASNTGAKVGPTQLAFFQAILTNLKEKPEVDWVAVATKTGYNSASTARCRCGQIRRELLAIESGAPVQKSSSKPHVKKENGEKQGRSKSIGVKGNEGGEKGRTIRIGKGNKVKDESNNEEDEEQYMEKSDDASDEIEIDGQGH